MTKKAVVLLSAAVFLLLAAAGALYLYLSPTGPLNPAGPEAAMQALLDASTEADWRERFCAAWTPPVTVFEDAGAVAGDVFDAVAAGESFTFRRRTDAGSRRAPVYLISAGETDLLQAAPAVSGEGWTVAGFTVPEGLLAAETHAVTLLAPPDADVTLNGVAVSRDYITNDSVPYADMTALESRFDAPPRRVQYTVPGLYGSATAEATRPDGVRLISENGADWVWTVPDAGAYSLSVLAPAEAVVTVCGAALTEADATGVGAPKSLLSIPEEYASFYPAFTLYEAQGLYTKPEITATDENGVALTAETGENGAFRFLPAGSESLRTEHEERVVLFLKNLSQYGAGNFNRNNALLSTVRDSEVYNYIMRATYSLVWMNGVTVTFGEIATSDYLPLGENAFTCRARMQCTTATRYQTVELDLSYEFLWVKQADDWLLLDLAFL